jgi:hypothetical protein
MPPAAFKDLWDTVKKERNDKALSKNYVRMVDISG